MPGQAVSLALAASIYPPALAALIALGRGEDVRLRVVLLVAAAYLTVLVTGTLMLFLFEELEVTGQQVRAPSAGLFIAAGLVLLLAAARLRRAAPHPAKPTARGSRIDRYLQSRLLVVALGVVLYVVPSPIFVGAVKAIADTNASTGQQLTYLVQMLLIMLWLIELPMLVTVAFPSRSVAALERINGWFAAHGRMLLVLLCGGVGLYLLIVGVVELVS